MTYDRNKLCYVAFSESRQFHYLYKRVIREALDQKGYVSLSPTDKDFDLFDISRTLFDTILLSIKRCDLVIADISDRNPNVLYELGLANAWGKPTIVLCHRQTHVPFDLASHYPFIFYESRMDEDGYVLKSLLNRINQIETKPKLFDPTVQRYINEKETLSIQLLSKDLNIVEAHKFIADILEFFQDKIDIQDFKLVESQSGSLKEIISASEGSIAKLAEKIIFCIPEWRKKKSDRLKVDAETEKIKAETEQIRSVTKTKEALALLEIVERSQKLGATRIVVGDKILIDTNNEGVIEITELKKLGDGN